MSGIAGILSWKSDPGRELLLKMLKRIKHRGPRGRGHYYSPPVVLGQRWQTGDNRKREPVSNERKSLRLVFDGRIYNHLQLRQRLKKEGHFFQSRSCEEVIPHLYEERGRVFISSLQGMYAFALWDEDKKELLLVRDPFGIKPLYYFQQGSFFAFASELKALLELKEVSLQVDREALWHYLSLQYVPEPLSILAGVRKLRPGHFLQLDAEGYRERVYWEPEFAPPKKGRSTTQWVDETLALLQERVDLYCQGEEEVGALLSGGIDSAILAALLRRKRRIKTFTVGFPVPGYSEIDAAAETARLLDTEHYQVLVTPGEYSRQLSSLLWYLDEPLADPSAISLFFGARLAGNFLKAVLSGEGADEFFGGYTIYREPYSLAPLRRLPSCLLKRMAALALYLPQIKGRNYIYRAGTPLEKRYIGNASIFSEEMKEELLGRVRGESTVEFLAPYYRRVEGREELLKMQYIDLRSWLPGDILTKADRMSAASSLELRAPFLDLAIFQLAAALPSALKIKGGETKYLLRRVARRLLPHEVAGRKKLGFPTPIRVWLKDQLKPLARRLVTSSQAASFFDTRFLESLLDFHTAGKGDYSRQLWTVMVFLLWYEEYSSFCD